MMRKSVIAICLAGASLAGAGLFAQDEPALEEAPKPSGKLYIPSNPRAAAYVLSRLSNQQLIEAPRQEAVLMALLGRKGLAPKDREAALDDLAKLHKSDRVTELVTALERNDTVVADAAGASLDLGRLLASSKRADLAGKQTALEALAGKAKERATRASAYAGLIIVAGQGHTDELWEKAAQDSAQLIAILSAVPLIHDADLRAEFQTRISPLARQAATAEIQQLAIEALPLMKGSESGNFGLLAELIRSGSRREAAVEAMLQLPRASWPKEQAGAVAQSIADAATKVPAAQRTETAFANLAKLGNELSTVLEPANGKEIRKALSGLTVAVLVVKTLPEQMLFDKARLVVEAGKPIEVDFENPDAMPHNFVVTAPGAHEEVGRAAEQMPPTPDARGYVYIPKSPKVIAATKLLEPGQKTKLSFTAPTEPGEYDYVCTFPGHWLRMFGKLVVTNDVEDYLAKNPAQEEVKITAWKAADFTTDLEHFEAARRNLAAGKQLTMMLGCVACHQIGKEGMPFGPNLAGVFTKYKDDPKAVLEQILEPSKIIEERYRPYQFELANGTSATGMIVAEQGDTLTIQSGPGLTAPLNKSEIKTRKPQELSPMPAGLLNVSSKEQVLDLLAFLKSQEAAAVTAAPKP